MFWDTKLPLWGNTSHWVASIKQLPADGKKESCLQWKVSKTTYVFMSLYTVFSCLIWKGSCFHKSILFTPSTSLFLCLRLQEQLCCSLPRQKPHLRSAGGSAGSRLRNTWPGRDRASRLYVLHACVCVYVSGRGWVCVCVCKVKSFGDFWRFQLKLKEDNGWFCSHTHIQGHVLAFPKVRPQGCLDLSVCHRTILKQQLQRNGGRVCRYLQFYLFSPSSGDTTNLVEEEIFHLLIVTESVLQSEQQSTLEAPAFFCTLHTHCWHDILL